MDGNGDVVVVGKVVLVGTSGNKNGVGAMSIWTSAASSAAALSTSSCSAAYGASSGLFAVSADGSQIVYFDAVDTACTVGTLTAAATDGTGKTALVPSVDLSGNYCYSALAFGGAAARAVRRRLARRLALLVRLPKPPSINVTLAPSASLSYGSQRNSVTQQLSSG